MNKIIKEASDEIERYMNDGIINRELIELTIKGAYLRGQADYIIKKLQGE